MPTIPLELAQLAADHPHAADYWRRHGRLPSYTARWGRVPTGPTSWPEKLLTAGGGPAGFASVTVKLPAVHRRLGDLLPGAWHEELMNEALHGYLAPTLGRLEWEFGADGCGWHLHGVLSLADVARLEALPGVDVHPRPIRTRRAFLKACRYGNKKLRQDATEQERWAVAEALETLKSGRARLPVLGAVFGVGAPLT